jgi:hypothetical protein
MSKIRKDSYEGYNILTNARFSREIGQAEIVAQFYHARAIFREKSYRAAKGSISLSILIAHGY